jgi:ankyrin repeat protein
LHHALSNPNVGDERIKLLISIGADVNQPGYRNVTPLIMAAAYASNPAIISRLLKSGASLTHVDDWGENALGAIRQNQNMSRRNKTISERLLNKPWIKGASDQ